MPALTQLWQIIIDPYYTRWTAPLQLLGDLLLSIAIVLKIPCKRTHPAKKQTTKTPASIANYPSQDTEIDWTAYMQQIETYLSGERDYAKISGSTGPLVYPAGHVYIYRLLYSLTDQGREIFTAQCIFIGVYIVALLFAIQSYRAAGVPPYLLPLLSLSKRVHSIFVLRLFNDGFAVLLLFAAVCAWQRRWWMVGTLAYGFGIGVKMSLLLALPAVGCVLWQGVGRNRALYQAQSILQLQTLLAYPFIAGGFMSYVTRAFELSRTFMFKWTVNWRFVGEQRFLGRPFSLLLMAIHLLILYTFGVGRWFEPANWTLSEAFDKFISPPPKEEEIRISRRVTPKFILTAVLSAMIIGCLCARSLHYQFFVYIAWSTPFLLWRSGMHPVLIYAICMAQEWAWNVYPSTDVSSLVVVGCLAATVFCVWLGTSPYLAANAAQKAERRHAHAE